MTQRGTDLVEKVTRQIDDIAEVFDRLGEADLTRADPGREGRTIGEAAGHIAEGYHFLVRFLTSAGHVPGRPPGGSIHGRGPEVAPPSLRARLAEARIEVGIIANLTDQQLDSVPPPKSSRFSNGRRTLEQLIEEVINHQEQHLNDLKSALASPAGAR